MTEQYDDAVARHYAAFRPPLHQMILRKVFRSNETFRMGLDVGCGTGYSAVALAAYCSQVVGLDSSASVLEKCQPHPHIRYREGRADDLQAFPEGSFDVITFAGSLFYTKSERLKEELLRVATRACSIVVYDFEVHLEELIRSLGLSIPSVGSDYDHAVGLDGWTTFELGTKKAERIQLDISPDEASHVLLSDSNRYEAMRNRFSESDPFEPVVALLADRQERIALHSTIYFATYHIG